MRESSILVSRIFLNKVINVKKLLLMSIITILGIKTTDISFAAEDTYSAVYNDKEWYELKGSLKDSEITLSVIDNICYIKINEFGKNAYEELNNIVEHNNDKDRIIIDLRNNSGGYIDEAANCAAIFIDKDTVFMKIVYDSGDEKIFCGNNADEVTKKIVILVNSKTASSSEAFALSLKKNGALLIGEKTYGKNSIQRLTKEKVGGIKNTVGKYEIFGMDFSENGTEPDIVIHNESTIVYDDRKYIVKETDNQLNKAIELLKEAVI